MSTSTKQQERNEKIIRGLMKLPPNRRCINCNSLGPQYVCTTFWTFVCTTCSGIHREFTHRVKSVSMATFTSQEVEALQNGGNQRAIEKYLRDRDPQRKRLTDNSNAEKIRQFIKDVYVEKKYATPKSSDKPPRDLQTIGSREEEIPRANSYHSFSQSPPYDYQYEERRYGKHAPALTRKPGSDKGLYEGKFSSFLSPTHSIDLANDTQSPNFQKDMGNPFGRSSDDTIQGLPQQRTSFGSFGSLDSMSFKSESVGAVEVDSEPGIRDPENEGWATFDTLNVDAVNNGTPVIPSSAGNTKTFVIQSSDGNSGGDSHPLFPDSWSPFEDFAADNLPSSTAFWQDLPGSGQSSLDTVSSQWPSLTNVSAGRDSSSVSAPLNGSHQFVVDSSRAMDTHSWDAFEEPTGQLNSQNAPTSSEHVETRHPSDIYYQVEYREPENFAVEVTQKAAPSLGISSHEVEHKNVTDSKPSNPFDQPYGSDIEPTNPFEFWDMSSLDAALPNGDTSSDFVDDETHTWFTSGSVTPHVSSGPQGALGFMAGQAGSTEITNLDAQGPVANVGGNPFA